MHRQTMAYRQGEQGDMCDLTLLTPVERRERVERLPLIWGSVIWLVVAILALFFGYLFAPLQKQQYRIVGFHLLAIGPRAEWQCSLLWCRLWFEQAENSCAVLHKASETWEDKTGPWMEDFIDRIDDFCEGESLDIVTYTLPRLCHSDASAFFSQACTARGTMTPSGMVAVASWLSTFFCVVALVTHAIVLSFLVNDYQLLIPAAKVVPRWKLSTKLRGAARHCSRMCGIAALATGLVYCGMVHWIEADGGFLTFTALGYVLNAPENRSITPGAGMFALLGIADVFILGLMGKEIFKAPVTPSGLSVEEHREVLQIELQAKQPQQQKAQPPQAQQLMQPLQRQQVQLQPPPAHPPQASLQQQARALQLQQQVVQPWATRSAGYPLPAPAPPGFGAAAMQQQPFGLQPQQWPAGWQRR